MKKYTFPSCKSCNSGELTMLQDNFGLTTWELNSKKEIKVNSDVILPVSAFACEECGYVELKLLAEK